MGGVRAVGAVGAVRAVREVSGGQVGCTLMNRRGECHDLLGLVFSVLGDGHGAGAGGDNSGGDNG